MSLGLLPLRLNTSVLTLGAINGISRLADGIQQWPCHWRELVGIAGNRGPDAVNACGLERRTAATCGFVAHRC